ncbi:MAG: hypothetical protein Q9M36_07545 [Sulfurovum sp.]|nr:hypothetical protein [Sulfurovum sp.]
MMKARDILFNTSWDEFDMGICKLSVPFFNQYIPFILFQNHDRKPKLTPKMIVALNHILELDIDKQTLYFEKYSKKDIPKVQEIHIDQDNDILDAVYSEVILSMPKGEYMSLVVKDGTIIHLDDKGTYLTSLKEA